MKAPKVWVIVVSRISVLSQEQLPAVYAFTSPVLVCEQQLFVRYGALVNKCWKADF